MRPFRSFLLLLFFLICFAGISYLLPGDLNLPKVGTLVPGELISWVYPDNTPNVVESNAKENEQSSTSHDGGKESNADSRITASASVRNLSASDSFPRPAEAPLKNFFDSLNYSKGQVRIMYYGDSQIEGDRLTSYLRSVLREHHGGTGPGLFLPVMPVPYTRSVYIRASSNWERYNYLSFKNGEISHNDLGPFLAYCRFLPENEISTTITKAWIRIVPSKFADSTSSSYDILRILYRNTIENVRIDVRAGNYSIITDSLGKGGKLQEFVCPLYNAKNVLIDFSGRVSPDIYGISIESKKGVIIDNIPQRGSAGLEFTMTGRENLREALGFYSPDLIVLHYGLNIVKNIRDNYSYYEKGLRRQISLLREISPNTSFLVVGLTDMAYGEGDLIKTYPNIPNIIDAQKKASEESGAFFWDAFKAMGGESSIIKWYELQPPLAKKDFVHFTDQGADTLAGLMVSDIFTPVTDSPEPAPLATERTDTSSIAPQVVKVADSGQISGGKGLFRTALSLIFSYDPDKPFIFTSPAFWIFFLFVMAGFSLLYKKLFIRNLYLFIISLFFYYKTGGLYLLLLIIVTLIDYTCGLLIHHSRTKAIRRMFIIISILSNIGILAYFKYTGFFIESFNNIFGTHIVVSDFLQAFSNNFLSTNFNVSNIILPVGISFFTFQSLSYTIDVYRRKLEPVRNIIDFGFYVSFFPQLVAGPIVRASEFIPQLYSKFNLTKREFGHALFLISKGLIKKIIISDFIAVNFVDRVFDLPASYSGFENLMAVYGYGLQIYCDFSGYTDIAIGLALILGFKLPLNFNSPYKSSSVAEFWKRWHISLSRWLKDYLYIPLGGNRKGKFRTILNLLITMLLGGLWHGADLRFIIWGGLHGIGLVINKIRSYVFGDPGEKRGFARTVSVFLTFQFVSFCWIFFRAPDLHNVGLMFRQIWGNFLPVSSGNIIAVYGNVFLLMAAGYIIHFLPEKLKESYRGFFIRIPLPAQLAVIMAVAMVLFQMRTTEVLPFIYFRF